MEAIKPTFRDLANAKTELLNKCLGGYTQNANESLNSTIWKYCPKTKKQGPRTVKTALAIAVSVFNDGATCFGAMLEAMDIRPGVFAAAFFKRRDTARISNAQRQAKSASLEERRDRRQKRLTHNDNCAAREGQPYLAGGH
ncbi:hypothetical protein V1264_018996 [Littorina saxatilis]|uniref:Uncharacterized protein n=1 Tax=Littorina saxatilis TaxID=31220 RepID=A0AAN9BEX1_9CAEN